MRGAALLPNLGAEEGDEGTAPRPGFPDAAALWLLLFSEGSRLIDREGVVSTPFSREKPVFPWLEDWGGGVPWLSTAKAVRRLEKLGLSPSCADPAIVHKVHDKAFALEVARVSGLMPDALSSSLRIFDPEELADRDAVEAALAELPDWADTWVLKPRFGSSGRGRVPGRGRTLEPVVAAGLQRLARRGGAILEPWLKRTVDLSAQLHLGTEGPELLGTTRQIVAQTGVYLGNRGVLEGGRILSGTSWDRELIDAALVIGTAAWREGFRGACGVDAFVYQEPGGEEVLRPVVEFNARFTMGTVALGLVARAREVGIGDRAGAFRFRLKGQAAEGGVQLGADSVLDFAVAADSLD